MHKQEDYEIGSAIQPTADMIDYQTTADGAHRAHVLCFKFFIVTSKTFQQYGKDVTQHTSQTQYAFKTYSAAETYIKEKLPARLRESVDIIRGNPVTKSTINAI